MITKIKLIPALTLLTVIMSACTAGLTFPPVSQTATGSHNQGQFVWHDLATYDPVAAKAFYSSVFGWQIEQLGEGANAYYVIKNGGKPIGGIFQLASKYGKAAEWISSVSVPDVDAAINYNKAAGGKTIFGKNNFKGRGTTALVQDPQGAFVALLHSESGDPGPRRVNEIETNSWLWNELWSTDLQQSIKFYEGLITYQAEEVKEANRPYFLFSKGGQTWSGVIGNPVEGARSAWMPYIKVKDVKETVEKAKAAGAHVMLEPNPSVRKGTVAVLMDPTGAQFTVQQWILR